MSSGKGSKGGRMVELATSGDDSERSLSRDTFE